MKTPRSLVWLVRCLVLLAFAGPSSGLRAQAPDYATIEPKSRALMRRPSLAKRTEGRALLASTGDPRAFATLVQQYADPEEPRDFVRSLLVTVLADYHPGEPPRVAWQKWRTAHATAGDAWLWFRALCIEERADPELWHTVAAAKLPTELRAAALRAAAAQPVAPTLDAAMLGHVFEIGAEIGTVAEDRALLLEGLIELFERQNLPLGKDARASLRSLVYAMGEPATSVRSRVVLSRSLARALGRDNLGLEANDWLEMLEDGPLDRIEMAYAQKRGKARPGFFGITEHGRSIAYVIDASDSMLEPLTPSERSELQPLTGPAAKSGARNTAEYAIDWKKVKTRFDGARELLKVALRQLGPDQQFSIVLFGDTAELLPATPSMVAATPRSVAAACRDLDAIKIGSKRHDRPYGTLRGQTNLHGGLRLAFRVGEVKGGVAARDVRPWLGGADTIYLLSDGAPNADDFPAVDANDSEYAGDPERGTRFKYSGEVTYPGPFAASGYLLADLRRQNLLRRCAIHVIGLGEADYALLRNIAAVGHGATVQIGKH